MSYEKALEALKAGNFDEALALLEDPLTAQPDGDMHALAGLACFKIVCTSAEDLSTVERLVVNLGLPRDRVWIMPEGTDVLTLQGRGVDLIEPTLAAGFNYTTRLHVLLWGKERGR